jgi:uncharacterized protein (DUF427 family)
MTEHRPLRPSAEHPITVTPTDGRVVVTAGGVLVADTRAALTLQEADYPAVQYIPLADIELSRLVRSDTATHCPYKGDAAYFGVTDTAGVVEDVAWTYERPYPDLAAIAGFVAFYPERAEITIS